MAVRLLESIPRGVSGRLFPQIGAQEFGGLRSICRLDKAGMRTRKIDDPHALCGECAPAVSLLFDSGEHHLRTALGGAKEQQPVAIRSRPVYPGGATMDPLEFEQDLLTCPAVGCGRPLTRPAGLKPISAILEMPADMLDSPRAGHQDIGVKREPLPTWTRKVSLGCERVEKRQHRHRLALQPQLLRRFEGEQAAEGKARELVRTSGLHKLDLRKNRRSDVLDPLQRWMLPVCSGSCQPIARLIKAEIRRERREVHAMSAGSRKTEEGRPVTLRLQGDD